MTLTFVGIAHSEWLEVEIETRAAKLDACGCDIVSCHVVLGPPHRHHGTGNPFSLPIAVTTRGEEIAVAREGLREELRVVIRDAFDVARRRHHHGDGCGRHRSRGEHVTRQPLVRTEKAGIRW